MQAAKAPPHNIELEQQILGALLTNNELYHKVGSVLRSEHFYDPVHQRIWQNVAGRISRDHIASPVTLKTEFETDAGLAELGGVPYLARLAGSALSTFAIADYARELVEISARRRLLDALSGVRTAIEGGEAIGVAKADLELLLSDVSGDEEKPRSMSLLAAHTQSLTELNEKLVSGHVGMTTGLRDLDELTGGFHNAEVTLIAGSTSMGKTALGAWVAYVAAKSGFGVGFVSLEMSEVALSQRIQAMDSEIPYQALRNAMSESTFRKVMEAAKAQEALPIQIYSDRVRDIPSILSETKRLQRHWKPNGAFKGFGMLVIDYIQLVRGRGSNRLEVLSQVADDTKQIAKMLNVPVVALAQVDRGLAKRENQVPFLSDLRGSGDLEFAADNVIFCHRPSYYLERTLQQAPPKDAEERADMEAALTATKGKMDLIVAKQRMGPIGQCRVGVDMGTNRFWDLEKQMEAEF